MTDDEIEGKDLGELEADLAKAKRRYTYWCQDVERQKTLVRISTERRMEAWDELVELSTAVDQKRRDRSASDG